MSGDPRIQRRHFLARALGALTAGAWLGRGASAERAEAAIQQDMPYIGEIRMFAGNFAPVGWEFCNGQLLPISENEALFQLIGTTYGGDGQSTFALPDLRGRAPIHVGTTWSSLGQMGGQESVTVTVNQLPAHSHALLASAANGDADDPAGRVPARNAAGAPHYSGNVDTTLAPGALLAAGASQPHNNMQPYLCVHFIISLYGVWPSPS